MKTIYHPATERGHANHGWLDSYHSFSFAQWFDPTKIQFGALRVLNDDRVAGGTGFGTHPHDNMEIVSIPLSGDLRHQDSTGKKAVIREGDVQIMSAGTGISHSEINHSPDKEVRFLQIWVFPKEKNISPNYDQKSFPREERINKLQTVVDPHGEEGVKINQDAWFRLGRFDRDTDLTYRISRPENGAYIFVLEGKAEIAGQALGKRDAIGVTDTESFDIQLSADTEILLMDIPMNV